MYFDCIEVIMASTRFSLSRYGDRLFYRFLLHFVCIIFMRFSFINTNFTNNDFHFLVFLAKHSLLLLCLLQKRTLNGDYSFYHVVVISRLFHYLWCLLVMSKQIHIYSYYFDLLFC